MINFAVIFVFFSNTLKKIIAQLNDNIFFTKKNSDDLKTPVLMERSLSIVEITFAEEKEYLELKSIEKEVDIEYIIDEYISSRSISPTFSNQSFEEITTTTTTTNVESTNLNYQISYPQDETQGKF
jgi:hypothetical protein